MNRTVSAPAPHVEWGRGKGPAPLTRPGHGNGGRISDAAPILLSPETLAYAARVREQAMKNKSYRASPVGGEVGRFLRSMRWSDKAQNSLDTYEIVLARLALDHAHYKTVGDFTTEALRDFLDEHWGDAAPATRRQRLAIVKSFFRFCVDERGLEVSPADRIKPPRKKSVERQGHSPDLLETLRRSQPTLRDQICVQLLGRLALRKNELRLLKIGDFDLGKGTFIIHGKGGKVTVMPIAFADLKDDLELHLVGRHPDEYLLYPQSDTSRPMTLPSVHRWFKKALAHAGLPDSIKIHELRHAAADNLWRQTGNLLLAQQLLRHESVATTQAYLHPTLDDLADALAAMQVVRFRKERNGLNRGIA